MALPGLVSLSWCTGCGRAENMAEFNEILGYEVIETLGFGARSTIYAVRDKDGSIFAMKHVLKASPSDQRFIDQALLEHDVASRFDHPRLRQSFKVYKQRNVIRVSEVFVRMEMVVGSTLENHQPADIRHKVSVCRQVAEGLGAMHKQNFVHADMKPNNVIVQENRDIKIIDFGQSCATGTVKERIQGTPDYIAPEQVLRRHITPKTDVFNLGATMYWLLTRKHVPTLIPRGKAGISFRTEDRCAPPAELNPKVPPALSSLVMDCIETEPKARPDTMEQVIQRLDIAAAQLKRQRENGNGGNGGKPDPNADSSLAGQQSPVK